MLILPRGRRPSRSISVSTANAPYGDVKLTPTWIQNLGTSIVYAQNDVHRPRDQGGGGYPEFDPERCFCQIDVDPRLRLANGLVVEPHSHPEHRVFQIKPSRVTMLPHRYFTLHTRDGSKLKVRELRGKVKDGV